MEKVKPRVLMVVLLLLGLFLPLAGWAESQPLLIKDINDSVSGTTSSITMITQVGDRTFFSATDGTHGQELWVTDGTAEGTFLVKDINPGSAGSSPGSMINVNGTLYFAAIDATNGSELWKSDGTEVGTVLVKDISPGTANSSPGNMVNVNGTLYFRATDGTNGYELWKSDGTATGTVLVKDIYPGTSNGNPVYLTNVNGILFFTASDATNGAELWKSDGTAAGTVLVKDINPATAHGNPLYLANVNGTLFFRATDATNGEELWKSDGTAAGTVLVKDIFPGILSGAPYFLTNVNGTLFFQANDGTYGSELWKSDGSAAGTVLVKDINPGTATSSPQALTNINGTLYFVATDATNGFELWKSDGTAAGTVLVKDINPGTAHASPSSLAYGNGIIYFRATDATNGTEVWKSDGTEAGTVLIKDIFPGATGSNPLLITNVNGAIIFKATDGSNSTELWKSDGTSAGTVLLKDIYSGSLGSDFQNGSSLEPLTNVNGTLYFAATDATNGSELWKSDGTEVGTVLVKDIYPGIGGSGLSVPTNVNGTLYFRATDETNGYELWKSDGTATGTVLVKDIYPGTSNGNPGYLTNINDILYFRAEDLATGTELWKSDGTEAGTVLVKDIYPGQGHGSPGNLTNVNGNLFFTATDSANGAELWKSDGTTSGTVLVKDIYPGATASYPNALTNVNGMLFFVAPDGVNGTELWKSDGTTAGTVLVKDIYPGASSSSPGYLVNINGTLFFTATDATNGGELWKSDGTEAGTVLVKDVRPGSLSGSIGSLINVNGTLFFTASDGTNGKELWKSDGTEAGTVLVKDINAGTANSNPNLLTNVNGTLYFTASNGTDGSELWKSDGTEAGTVQVDDIYPGTTGSFPQNLTEISGNLVFSATDQLLGKELFILDLTNPQVTVTSPSPLSIFIGGSDILVSGTAVDDVTGVTGVEVSTNGGTTWGSATDTSVAGDWSSWEYNWATPTDGGDYQILARSIDRATNLSSAAGPSVTLLPLYTLSTTVIGDGRIDGDLFPPLSCTAGVCAQGYVGGSIVNLTATPGSGYVFDGWSGGGCNGADPCTVTMDAAKSVTATFSVASVVIHPLTVTTTGSNGGVVISSPAGITCGAICNDTFDDGTLVTLTAVPSANYVFTGWSGACTGPGTCEVTMTAAKNVTATFKYSPLGISTSTLSSAYINESTSRYLSATGGVKPYTWSVFAGSLPPGMTLNAATGTISGTPAAAGTYNFTVQATDSHGTPAVTTKPLSLAVVIRPLSIFTGTLPNGFVNMPSSRYLSVVGGIKPYSWSVTTGNLPPGMTLNATTGTISGTPTAAGTYGFTVQVTDSQGTPAVITKAHSLTVAGRSLSISTGTLTGAFVNESNNRYLTAVGGVKPYTWVVTAGSLPPGMSLNASTGTISGTPAVAGTYGFTVQVTDSQGTPAASKVHSLTVSSRPLSISTGTLPNAAINESISLYLVAVGGVKPYSWAVTSGSLPPGMTLNATTGVISGTPTVVGPNNFTVQATDSQGTPAVATKVHSLTVSVRPLTISTSTLLNVFVNKSSTRYLAAGGGIAPYTWAVTGGSLPPGMTLNATTGVISGTPTAVGTYNFTAQVTDSQGTPAVKSRAHSLKVY